MVQAAMKSGKKVIAAGPGNPPAVVDETADIALAARNIVQGASLDNNIICTSEKEVIAVSAVADELKRRICAEAALNCRAPTSSGCAVSSSNRSKGAAAPSNKKLVGKSACVILHELGIAATPETRLVLCEVDSEHPLVWTEQLMPVLPLVRVPTVDDAINLAVGVRRRSASYGHYAFAQHREAQRHGPAHQLLDLCQERLDGRRPGNGRGGVHVVHHRQPHRRRHDHGP